MISEMIFMGCNLHSSVLHGGIKSAYKITVGTSASKYVLTARDNNQFLLKIYTHRANKDMLSIAELNRKMIAAGIRLPRIIEVGMTQDGLFPFELMEWIPGHSLTQLLNMTPLNEHYRKGVAAGQLLRTIHSSDCFDICAQAYTSIEERMTQAIANFNKVRESGAPIYLGEVFEKCLEESTYRPVDDTICLLHGDYHAENIIEDDKGLLWGVDWIYNLYGSPIEDFVRIFVSAEKHPEFAKGQIDGYFGGAPPLEFWEHLKLLVAIQQLEMLLYPLGRLSDGQEIKEHQHQIVYEQYKEMKSIIPKFYTTQGGKMK